MLRWRKLLQKKCPPPSAADEGPTLRELFSPKSDVFTVLAIPVAILLFDHQWIFPGPERDPWVYFGYFKAAPEWAKAFAGAYFGSRLSVILPGFLLHHVLPSLVANVALHLALAWLALLSFYGVARALFGRPTALLSTICLGCQPFFLTAVGRNYVDGFGIAYFLAALLAATQAARRPGGRFSLFAAGALSMAVVTANLVYAVYLPVIALHFIVLNRGAARRPLLPSLAAVTAAAMGSFAAFCVTNKLLGGRFLYLIASTAFASTFLKTASPFWTPPGAWLPRSLWLVFPALVFLGALATVIALRTLPPERRRDNLFHTQILFLGFLAILFASSLPRHPGALFQFWYYASLTIPVAALAFAGQLSLALDRDPARSLPFAWGAAALLIAAYALRTPKAILSLRGPVVLVALLAGLPAIVVVVSRAAGNSARLVFVASLAASSVIARDFFAHDSGSERYGGDRAAIFAQVDRSVKAYRRVDGSGQLFFWFDQRESAGVFYDMVAATSLSGWRIVTMGFPALVPGGLTFNGTPVAPGMKIVVLCGRPTAESEADEALRALGFHAFVIGEERIDGPAGSFSMLFLEVRA